MASSILDNFTPWSKESHIPGVAGLMIPSTFGKGLQNIHEGMVMSGYKSHEIKYIRDYAQIRGIAEQEAVVNLGIGTQDRMAAAIALWKGVPWLPMKEAGGLNIKPLKSYGLPLQNGEKSPRAVPLAENKESILYITHIHDDYSIQSISSSLLTTQIALKSSAGDKYATLLQKLLVHASYHGYSDIHFSPLPGAGMVEGRLDGIKDLFLMMDRHEYSMLIGVIVNSLGGNMDPRLQGEGRIPVSILPPELNGRFEFRLQYMSTVQGISQGNVETGSVTLRILNLMSETGDLDTLGFAPEDLSYLKRITKAGKGLIISTGPTGSGKTTTQYALMRDVDAIHHSVQTVENPVEIKVGIWRQHQLIREGAEHKEWLNWNKGLLRNDPDVVLQGEVRTADLFLQVADMANTGHLVFTTFHASSAALAIGRIRQMRTEAGDPIDIDMVSSLLHCIIAQGLARKLCPHCSISDDSEEVQRIIEPIRSKVSHVHPKKASETGCSYCLGSGYRGRFLVYEILRFNRKVRDKIVDGAGLAELEKEIPEEKRMNGYLRYLVAEGKTSLEEAYRLSEELA